MGKKKEHVTCMINSLTLMDGFWAAGRYDEGMYDLFDF